MHSNTVGNGSKNSSTEAINNQKLNALLMKDDKIKDILVNDRMTAESKRNMMGLVNEDQFFQNIYDKEGNIIQKTREVGDLDLKEILNGEDITGKTILDLGTNCGKYCFESIYTGAGKAIGVDVTNNITKFIEYLGMESSVEYNRSDILDYTPSEDIDITYLFDLMCYLSEEDALMLLERMLSYTKGKIFIVDLFSEDYRKFHRVMKLIRGNKLTHDVRTTHKNNNSEDYFKVIEIDLGRTKVG